MPATDQVFIGRGHAEMYSPVDLTGNENDFLYQCPGGFEEWIGHGRDYQRPRDRRQQVSSFYTSVLGSVVEPEGTSIWAYRPAGPGEPGGLIKMHAGDRLLTIDPDRFNALVPNRPDVFIETQDYCYRPGGMAYQDQTQLKTGLFGDHIDVVDENPLGVLPATTAGNNATFTVTPSASGTGSITVSVASCGLAGLPCGSTGAVTARKPRAIVLGRRKVAFTAGARLAVRLTVPAVVRRHVKHHPVSARLTFAGTTTDGTHFTKKLGVQLVKRGYRPPRPRVNPSTARPHAPTQKLVASGKKPASR